MKEKNDCDIGVKYTFFDKIRILLKINPYFDDRVVYVLRNILKGKFPEKAILHPYKYAKNKFKDSSEDIIELEEVFLFNIEKNNPRRIKNFLDYLGNKFSKKEKKQLIQLLDFYQR